MDAAERLEVEQLQRQIEDTKASLEKNIGVLAGEIRSTVHKAADVGDIVVSGVDRVISFSERLRAHPYQAVTVAVVSGLLLGRIWGALRSRREVLSLAGEVNARSGRIARLLEPELAAVRARAVALAVEGLRSLLARQLGGHHEAPVRRVPVKDSEPPERSATVPKV